MHKKKAIFRKNNLLKKTISRYVLSRKMKNNPNKSLKRSIAKHTNCIIRGTLRKEEISRGIIRLSRKTLWFPFVWENLKKRNTKDPWHFPRFVFLVLGIQSKNIRQRRRRDRHGTGNRNGRQIPVYKTQKAAAFKVCRFQSKPFRRPFFEQRGGLTPEERKRSICGTTAVPMNRSNAKRDLLSLLDMRREACRGPSWRISCSIAIKRFFPVLSFLLLLLPLLPFLMI